MGKHSAPEGKPSTSEKMTGKRNHIGGDPKHETPAGSRSTSERNTGPAGSDLPPRDQGIR